MSTQKKYHLKKLFMIFQLILILLSIHKYLMVKNNTKQLFDLLKKYLFDY